MTDGALISERVKKLTRGVQWRQVAAIPVKFNTQHPQGMIKIGDTFYVSSVEIKTPTKRYPQLQDGYDRDTGLEGRIIGQFDLPESRLRRALSLKAVFNVESNFLPNVDYGYCFRNRIRVLSTSPVFAEPVAEAALGMAIDLARGISRSDRHFRQGSEEYGLAANREAFSLFRQDVGLIGLGDLGRAILPLLRPFGCRVRAYDPWLPGDYIQALGCEPASLDEVLRRSRLVIVVWKSSTAPRTY